MCYDLCNFFKNRNFPYKKNINVKLTPNSRTSCSCTELFLIQNAYYDQTKTDDYASSFLSSYYFEQYYHNSRDQRASSHCFNSSFRRRIRECHFARRLNNCRHDTAASSTAAVNADGQSTFYMNDWAELSRQSHFILSVYLNPAISGWNDNSGFKIIKILKFFLFFCLGIAIIVNILIVIVLHGKCFSFLCYCFLSPLYLFKIILYWDLSIYKSRIPITALWINLLVEVILKNVL